MVNSVFHRAVGYQLLLADAWGRFLVAQLQVWVRFSEGALQSVWVSWNPLLFAASDLVSRSDAWLTNRFVNDNTLLLSISDFQVSRIRLLWQGDPDQFRVAYSVVGHDLWREHWFYWIGRDQERCWHFLSHFVVLWTRNLVEEVVNWVSCFFSPVRLKMDRIALAFPVCWQNLSLVSFPRALTDDSCAGVWVCILIIPWLDLLSTLTLLSQLLTDHRSWAPRMKKPSPLQI